MKVSAIRKLVEKQTILELKQAESDIIQEKSASIEIEGKDEAEKLSNVIAALWILEEMKSKGLDFKEALSLYTKKVR
jgi:hypothetical protein